MSAPFAVAICSVFGFRRYLIAGLIASAVQLILGTHTLLNVGVAMIFRVTAGAIVAWGANHPWAVAFAGPAGTAAARLCLSYVLHAPAAPLLLAALPGMVYTALLAAPLAGVLARIAGSDSKRAGAIRSNQYIE